MIPLNLLRLKGMHILQQLQLEEALLRADEDNWCLINDGSSSAAIVMGISGKAENLINQQLILQKPIPIIRRFSGGGTVIVDSSTYFITWILNGEAVRIPPFPEQVLHWTTQFYHEAIPHLKLRENDYVIGNKKCGGNAQYFRKNRFLHHTSFLWDYDSEKMEYLMMPLKVPSYRENRSHQDFLCKLKDHCHTKEHLENGFLQCIQSHFRVKEMNVSCLMDVLQRPHRKATCAHP